MRTGTIIKIAVVIPRYGLVGGGEKFAAELTERLAENSSLELHVFANQWRKHSDLIQFHKVPIVSFPRYLTTVSFAWLAQQKIRQMGFDIIHSHERIFDADIVSLHSIPHRIWMREVRRKRFLSMFDHATIWVEKRMIARGKNTLFLPVSGIAQARFVEEYPHILEHVEILHPGVDTARFSQLDKRRCRESIRRQFGFRESDTILLFVSMNFELKGLGQLISAIATIKSHHLEPGLQLLVVGKGNTRKYKRMADDAGLGDAVRFAGVMKERIEEIYMASDIFSLLSSFDTFGMTVLEAMAASLPVVITPNVGARDLVQEGINGFVVDREDIDTISRRILLLLDRGKRNEMGLKAYQTAQAHNWDTMVNKVLGFYEHVLSTRKQ